MLFTFYLFRLIQKPEEKKRLLAALNPLPSLAFDLEHVSQNVKH